MLCFKVIRSRIDLKLKVRTNFLMYEENSNPYIQGTTIPCDVSLRLFVYFVYNYSLLVEWEEVMML